MDLEDILKGVISDQIKKELGHGSVDDAAKCLKGFLQDTKRLTADDVGKSIVRNRYGALQYVMPKENQSAIVQKVFDDWQCEPNAIGIGAYDAVILVSVAKDLFLTLCVDSRFYDLADEEPKNVTKFPRK